MNEIIIILFTAILFFIFTPGIFFTISKKSSKTNIAVIHAFLFAFVVCLIHIIFYNNIYEGLISTYNGNYPISCNSSTVGKLNENNYMCTKKDVNYEWVKTCDNSIVGEKNEMGKVCTSSLTGDIFVYNWT
jgi:predicted membrane protein